MEFIGLVFGCPIALAASIVWCLLARSLLAQRRARVAMLAGSAAVFLALAVEVVLLATLGAIAVDQRLPMLLYTVHLLVVLALPPAVATSLLWLTRNARPRSGALCGCVFACWMTCLSCVMFNIALDEATHDVHGNPWKPVAAASHEGAERA